MATVLRGNDNIDSSVIVETNGITPVDNAIVRFDGIDGKVQDSTITVDDYGAITMSDGIFGHTSTISMDGANGNLEIGSSGLSTNINLISRGGTRKLVVGDDVLFYGDNSSIPFHSLANDGIVRTYGSILCGVAGDGTTYTNNSPYIRVFNIDATNYTSIHPAVLPTDLTMIARTNGIPSFALYGSGTTQFGADANTGPIVLSVKSGTLIDGESSVIQAQGGIAGATNRMTKIGVLKHSTIANACAFIQMTCQDGATNYVWVDDVDQLRISPSSSGIIGTTSGTIVGTQTSDERVKNIVGNCPYGLQEILDLETYKYSMKNDVEGSFKLGFVAQQAMGVVPESVYDTGERLTEPVTVIKQKIVKEAVEEVLDEKGNVITPAVEPIYEDYEDIEYQETEDTVTKLAMDYQMMIPVLVNAMKEQQAMIETLKQEVAILKGVK